MCPVYSNQCPMPVTTLEPASWQQSCHLVLQTKSYGKFGYRSTTRHQQGHHNDQCWNVRKILCSHIERSHSSPSVLVSWYSRRGHVWQAGQCTNMRGMVRCTPICIEHNTHIVQLNRVSCSYWCVRDPPRSRCARDSVTPTRSFVRPPDYVNLPRSLHQSNSMTQPWSLPLSDSVRPRSLRPPGSVTLPL